MTPQNDIRQRLVEVRREALLRDLLKSSHETEWLEFKENYADPDGIGERIAAISNSARLHDKECGYIVWGIDDKTHKIVGTTFDPDQDVGSQPLKMRISQKLNPCPHFAFHKVKIDEQEVVLLEICAAADLPVSFNKVPKIRIGSATPDLRNYPAKEKLLIEKLRPFAWEHGVATTFLTSEDVISLLDYDSFFTLKKIPRPVDNSGILNKLLENSMISEDVGGRWNISNLGAILFARDLSLFPTLERKALRIIQYTGKSRIHARPEQKWLKGYANGFVEFLRYLEGILPAREVIGGAVRIEERVYPLEAIKELLANSLIHQDMTEQGTGPKVEVFEDRIEFTNPGEPLTDWRKLFGAEPRSRNEKLAMAMRKMEFCEERGSGLRRTIEATNQAHLLPPEFIARDKHSKVMLYGVGKSFDHMNQKEKIRSCLTCPLFCIHSKGEFRFFMALG